MYRPAVVLLAALALGACEYDTSPEHLTYCANGGLFGCGRAGAIPPHVCAATGQCGMRPEVAAALMAAGAATLPPKPAPSEPVVFILPPAPAQSLHCVSRRGRGDQVITNCR